MRTSKVLLTVLGVFVGIGAAAMVFASAGLLWANATQSDADGFFTTPATRLASERTALVSEDIELGVDPGDWIPARLATVRIEVEQPEGEPVFVGLGPEEEVAGYLDGVAHTVVSDIGAATGVLRYADVEGMATAAPPASEDFWAVSSEGAGPQMVEWELSRGTWSLVIMNADASPGVMVEASAAASSDWLVPVSIGLLVLGLALGTAAALMLVAATRDRSGAAPGASDADEYGPYPVALEADLEPGLSRWLWLVKWILIVPHVIVLLFLWLAFFLLTVVAGFAILITGRYPRGIFEFNVGVMRWTWRLSYYSYGGLGTDQYPLFTLSDVDYPARFDVSYPEELSRGLVLVKWWLLAIPHYVVVGLFTSGVVWTATGMGDTGAQWGTGLIGILVLIAGVALVFTGRYPRELFDLIIGLQRWVFRVWAYAALMRDEYPPFRLDTGGEEPRDPSGGSPLRSPGGAETSLASEGAGR